MTGKRVPWWWWFRMAVTFTAIVVFDSSHAGPRGWLEWPAALGVGMLAAAVCDLTRWSYRQAQKEARR